ncbi:hypothetical protein HOLleu_03864 [Holothuria leucospilota]|uniref:SWIM-type domain-containing protein n=1 Tax=Holothuria leucospilota TaxID=206669 RepID=A0A9Q1CT47_HOLLE|nr:hypothetical protein HOLleu_03864 [Holothuria leucospilota]
MHSQRLNEEPLQPWIAANVDGSIICGHCNCMVGLGKSCSHIGAVLFKIEAAVRLGYTKAACTDMPCKWNNDFKGKKK